MGAVETDKVSDVTGNAYYKKLQQELKEKNSTHSSGKQAQQEQEQLPQKIEKVTHIDPSAFLSIEDKVDIRSISWEKDKKGNFELKTQLSPTVSTSIDLKNDGSRILRLLGHKIDLSSQVDQLKENYMQNIVQSRTANFFLAKFAQFKVGINVQLLSWLGILPQELEILKKKALEGAVVETEGLLVENIYNMELSEIIYGNTKKVKRTIAQLKEIEKQLMGKVGFLGKRDYWNKVRLLEERIRQCKKIEEEFLKERGQLHYQQDYMRQAQL